MSKLLQINVTANWGSTGKIAEAIGKLALSKGWESWIAFGRGQANSASNLIRIGSKADVCLHGAESRLLDNHGRASVIATKLFIRKIKGINPDVIHLHNIHGYYINYPLLFKFLKEWGGPVVWTLHDCWPFTGHCSHFITSGCEKWKTGCGRCPSLGEYPSSLFFDNSQSNFRKKKRYFTSLGKQLTLVPVSKWIAELVGESFFGDTNKVVIHNGIDLSVFKPCAPKEKIILGVANVWSQKKGFDDFFKLRGLLGQDYRIVMVGLEKNQIQSLPVGIEGIERTNGQSELARIYSSAQVLVNPTYEDTYSTVNLEAQACGTPVITYRTGGTPETISPATGIVVQQGDLQGLVKAVEKITRGESYSSDDCRRHALAAADRDKCFNQYIDLYNSLLSGQVLK